MREIMTAPSITATQEATVADVARAMVEHRVGSVVIVDSGDPGRATGIVTETDLVIKDERVPHAYPATRAARLLDRWVQSREGLEAALAAAARRLAADVMSAPVHTVEADADVWEAARLMLEHDVKRLPVMEEGKLIGIVARHDLLKAMVAASRAEG